MQFTGSASEPYNPLSSTDGHIPPTGQNLQRGDPRPYTRTTDNLRMEKSIFVVALLLLLHHAMAADNANKLPSVVAKPPTVILDLRDSVVTGVAARFLVDRQNCVNIIKERAPGLSLKLASDVEDVEYDSTVYSEILVALVDIEDTTLSAEFGEDAANAPVSTEGTVLLVGLPVVSTGEPVILLLATYTDEERPLMVPYNTNYRTVTRVDSITLEAVSDVIAVITILDGDDRLQVRVDTSAECQNDPTVGRDFDNTIGAHLCFTNYPRTFDWGCESYSFAFCDRINAEEGEPTIAIMDGNVCTSMTTTKSVRCPVSVTLEDISGGFLEAGIPVQVGNLPLKSFEAEQVNREHSTGIVFPCMRKREYRQMSLDEMWNLAKRDGSSR